MLIRAAVRQDWIGIYPFFSSIVAAGRTYAFPENLSLEDARPWWMEQPPGVTVVAVEGAKVVGSAKMGPNWPGRGSHIATGSFMVDPDHRGRGVGRALGSYVLDWARTAGYWPSITPSTASSHVMFQRLGAASAAGASAVPAGRV